MSAAATPERVIRKCVERCSRHVDGRGPWQAEKACADKLGGLPNDIRAAAAARRLGEWIRSRWAA